MTKTVKRSLCALLSIALLVCCLPLGALAEEETGVIRLNDAEDLVRLAENCRLDSWSRDKIVYLDADIDLSGTGFGGIPSFGGRWEGQGHTVSGLNLTADGSVQGLFRYIQTSGAVHNTTASGTVQPGAPGPRWAALRGRTPVPSKTAALTAPSPAPARWAAWPG